MFEYDTSSFFWHGRMTINIESHYLFKHHDKMENMDGHLGSILWMLDGLPCKI